MSEDFLSAAQAMGGYDGEPSAWAKFEAIGTNYTGQIVSCRWAPNLKYKSTEVDAENPKMIVVEITLTQPTISPATGQVLMGEIKKDNQRWQYPYQTGCRVSLTYKPKSQAMAAFADALMAKQAIAPLPLGIWSDTFSAERPSDKGNPQKLHTCAYQPPSASNMLAGAVAGAPYEPGPAAAVPLATQQVYQAPAAAQPAPWAAQPAAQPVYTAPPQPVYANGALVPSTPSVYEPPATNPNYGQPIYQGQPVQAAPPQPVYQPVQPAPAQQGFPAAVDPNQAQMGGHDQSFAQAPAQQLQPIGTPTVGVAAPPWAQAPGQAPEPPAQGFGPPAAA